MSNIETLKAVQCLIGSNCLVSTPESFYAGPKGYVSNTSLKGVVEEHSDSIDSIIKELTTKISEEDLKTINGMSLIGKGNIQITEQGIIDLSNYITKEESSVLYPLKEEVVYSGKKVLNLSDYNIRVVQDEEGNYYTDPIPNTTSITNKNNSILAMSMQDFQAIVAYFQDNKYNTYIQDYNGYLYSVVNVDEGLEGSEVIRLSIMLSNMGGSAISQQYVLILDSQDSYNSNYPVFTSLSYYINQNIVNASKIYTDVRIEAQESKHVQRVSGLSFYKDQRNQGTLSYCNTDIKLSYEFDNPSGLLGYDKLYIKYGLLYPFETPDGGAKWREEIWEDPMGKHIAQTSGSTVYVYWENNSPTKLLIDAYECPCTGLVELKSGIYYLPEAYNPILISSSEATAKAIISASEQYIKDNYYKRVKVTLIQGITNIKDFTEDSNTIYEIYYNNNIIATIIKINKHFYITGSVDINSSGNVYVGLPKNASIYEINDSGVVINYFDNKLESKLSNIDNAAHYHVIRNITQLESAYAVGTMIEVVAELDSKIEHYQMWKAPSGNTIYSKEDDIYSHFTDDHISIYSDSQGIYPQSGFFNFVNDSTGIYFYDVDNSIKYNLAADINPIWINTNLINKVGIVTSTGIKVLSN